MQMKNKSENLIECTKPVWQQINNQYLHLDESNAWKLYPSTYCVNYVKPSMQDLSSNLEITEKSWKMSAHPYCKSCYGLYSQVCDKVAPIFGIMSHKNKIDRWKINDLEQMIEKIESAYFKNPLIKLLPKIAQMIDALAACIEAREYHANICYFHDEKEQQPETLSSEGEIKHKMFVVQLCKNLQRLVTIYAKFADIYHTIKKNNSTIPVIDLSTQYEHVFNICRHNIKVFGSATDINESQKILQTDTPTVPKSSKSNKLVPRSRAKKGYKVDQNQLRKYVN